jgi:formate hydrogenlyase transcriptional activator
MIQSPCDEQGLFSREQYRTLLEVAEAIAVHRDLDGLFHELARRIPCVVPFDYINLILHHPERDTMRLHILAVPDQIVPEAVASLSGTELPVDESPGGQVMTTQQPFVVEDVTCETRYPKLMPVLQKFGVQSICMVPLTSAIRRLGGMAFGTLQRRAYPPSEIAFMQQVAKLVAVAVDNVLHDESEQAAQRHLRRERDRVQLILDVNNAVVSHLSLDELFPAVSACLRKAIEHHGSSLVLYNHQTQRYRVHVLSFEKNESFVEEGTADETCRTPASIAITTRQPALFCELQLKEMVADSPCAQHWLSEGVKTFCSIPLLSRGQAIGALDLARRCEDKFTADEIELLSQVAGQVSIAVENAHAYQEISALKDKLAKEKLYLEEEIRTERDFEEIVGESAALRRVLKQVETVAPTDSTVLICGETGTGKELIARALHQLSPRRERTFVKINCAAIPTGLLESELFGHEKGAFTGAIAQKIGRFELAHEGTLFLDEVGDVPPELQPKLLRVLQEQEFERLGGTKTLRVDVRLVAATNRNLAQMAADGQYRSDLYYRLNVFPISLPALRERRDDIPRLVRHFAQRVARRMGRQIETIPAEAMDALVQYAWPGNIRELENVIERAVILSPGPTLNINAGELNTSPVPVRSEALNGAAVTLDDAERQHILNVLRETRWVLGGPKGAAARLAMKRTTLQSKMKKLGIVRPS